MDNKVPHFFFSENKLEAPGAGFITSTHSSIIGKVLKFDNSSSFHKLINGKYAHQVAEVGSYMIAIEHYAGYMAGSRSVEDKLSDTADELKAMAKFYFEHTIKPKESYYKRYLLHPNEEV